MASKEMKKREMMNSTVSATNYSIDFLIDVSGEKETFQVHEKISLNVANPTKKYMANGKNLTVENVKLITSEKEIEIPNDEIEYDNSKDIITFNFPEEIQKGEYYLSMDVVGKYGDVSGLYLSKYSDKEGNHAYMATTQFEAADARRAFVCEDEPLFPLF